MQAGRIADAVAGLEQALARAPDHVEALHFLGFALFQSGDEARAVALMDRSVAASPHNTTFRNNLAYVYRRLGRTADAEPHLRAALAVDAFDLIGKYHEVALDNADVDVEVAESFRLEISLTPVLGDEDLARMPPHEAHNLSLGQSDLIETGSFAFPAHFRISGPEYELME